MGQKRPGRVDFWNPVHERELLLSGRSGKKKSWEFVSRFLGFRLGRAGWALQLQGVKVLTFQTDRVWNPKMAGVSDDTRDLGIAVAIP